MGLLKTLLLLWTLLTHYLRRQFTSPLPDKDIVHRLQRCLQDGAFRTSHARTQAIRGLSLVPGPLVSRFCFSRRACLLGDPFVTQRPPLPAGRMVSGPLGQEAACTLGTPDFFGAIFGSFAQDRNCLSVIGADLPGAPTLGHAGVRDCTPLLSPWAGVFPVCL